MASLDPQTQIREGVFYFLTAGNTSFTSPLHIEGGPTDVDIAVNPNNATYNLSVNGSVVNTITQDKDGISFSLPSKALLTSTATGTILNTPLSITTNPASNAYFDITPNATSTTLSQQGGTVAFITLNNNGLIQTSDTLNVGVDASANITVGPITNQALITPTSYVFQANGAQTGGMKLEGGVLKIGADANVSSAPAISIGTNVTVSKTMNAQYVNATGDITSTGTITSQNNLNLVSMSTSLTGGIISAGSGSLRIDTGLTSNILTDALGNMNVTAGGNLTFTANGSITLDADSVNINGTAFPTALVWAYSMGTDQYINMNPNPFSGTYVAWNNTIYENPTYAGRLSNGNTTWIAPVSGWYSFTVTLQAQSQDNSSYLSMELVQVGGGTTTSIGLILYNWMAVYSGSQLSVVRGDNTISGQFTKYLLQNQGVIMMGGQAGNNNAWQNAQALTQMNVELLSVI